MPILPHILGALAERHWQHQRNQAVQRRHQTRAHLSDQCAQCPSLLQVGQHMHPSLERREERQVQRRERTLEERREDIQMRWDARHMKSRGGV